MAAGASMMTGLVGAGMKMAADVQETQAQTAQDQAIAKGYDYDASVAETNAAVTRTQTTMDAMRVAVMARRSIGAMSANYGASGVSRSGSVLDVLKDSAAQAQQDVDNVKRQGDLKLRAYQQEAYFAEQKAGNYRMAGREANGMLGLRLGADVFQGLTGAYASIPSGAGRGGYGGGSGGGDSGGGGGGGGGQALLSEG